MCRWISPARGGPRLRMLGRRSHWTSPSRSLGGASQELGRMHRRILSSRWLVASCMVALCACGGEDPGVVDAGRDAGGPPADGSVDGGPDPVVDGGSDAGVVDGGSDA